MKQKFMLLLVLISLNNTQLLAQGTIDPKQYTIKKEIDLKSAKKAIEGTGTILGTIANPHKENPYADLRNAYSLQVWEVTDFPIQKDDGPIKGLRNRYLKIIGQIKNLEIEISKTPVDTFFYAVRNLPLNKQFVVVFVCKYGANSPYVQNGVQDKYFIKGAFFSGQKIEDFGYQKICTQNKLLVHQDISVDKKSIKNLH